MNYENLLLLVRKRRSVKRFKADSIPDKYVDKIIEAARWAPSGANSQPWEFIVIKDKQIKDSIVDITLEYRDYSRKVELTRKEDLRAAVVGSLREPGFKNAPVFIILCGDKRTQDAYPLLTKLSSGDSVFESSLASAFLYMHLAAVSLGLGSQWVSATARPFAQCLIKDLLKIPPDLEIYDMMAVGYPAFQPKSRVVREKSEMVHYEKYDRSKYRTDDEIKAFIVNLRQSRSK
ncbi:nitroreductase family protein [Thermodesulfobacteriota bacterium]